jgi:hypothetical protein
MLFRLVLELLVERIVKLAVGLVLDPGLDVELAIMGIENGQVTAGADGMEEAGREVDDEDIDLKRGGSHSNDATVLGTEIQHMRDHRRDADMNGAILCRL